MLARSSMDKIIRMRRILSVLLTLENTKTVSDVEVDKGSGGWTWSQGLIGFHLLWQVVFWYLVYGYALSGYRTIRGRGPIETLSSAYISLVQKAYNLLLTTPPARQKLKEQLDGARRDLKRKLIDEKEAKVEALERHTHLPPSGKGRAELRNMFNELDKIHKADWETGKVR